jgi:hypothetical protein
MPKTVRKSAAWATAQKRAVAKLRRSGHRYGPTAILAEARRQLLAINTGRARKVTCRKVARKASCCRRTCRKRVADNVKPPWYVPRTKSGKTASAKSSGPSSLTPQEQQKLTAETNKVAAAVAAAAPVIKTAKLDTEESLNQELKKGTITADEWISRLYALNPAIQALSTADLLPRNPTITRRYRDYMVNNMYNNALYAARVISETTMQNLIREFDKRNPRISD